MSFYHSLGVNSIRGYFYLTGNKPNEEWINCHREYDGAEKITYRSNDEIPLEFDSGIKDNLNELLRRTQIEICDYQEVQEYKSKLLSDYITILYASLYIDVIKPYGENLSREKEFKRFLRLNSLIMFVTTNLLQLPDEMTMFIAQKINENEASDFLLLDEKDTNPLMRLIAISSYDQFDELDSSMFDIDNNLDETQLNVVFNEAKNFYKKRKKKKEKKVYRTLKRLTYQDFKK